MPCTCTGQRSALATNAALRACIIAALTALGLHVNCLIADNANVPPSTESSKSTCSHETVVAARPTDHWQRT